MRRNLGRALTLAAMLALPPGMAPAQPAPDLDGGAIPQAPAPGPRPLPPLLTPQQVAPRRPAFVAPTFAAPRVPGQATAPAPGAAPGVTMPDVVPPAGADARPLSTQALVALAEAASVFVVGADGTGSGFFINADTIVTNSHVVGAARSGAVRVTSKRLGRMLTARVIYQSNLSGREWPDIAFLRVDGPAAPAVIPISPEINKLDPIVAAGFPGMVLRQDPNFKRLLAGDASAAPELVFERGTVSTFENAGANLIMHSAFLAGGNSGGPLLDPCGRAIGINSAILRDNRAAGQFNVAQDAREIARQARRLGIALTYVGGRCLAS
jgi:S1-C subfamily serine protease